jgi:hypothetical protein
MRNQALPISELKAPSVLYKYRNYNKLNVETLLSYKIFIPNAKQFNDPLDSNLPFRYNRKDLTSTNIYLKCLELSKQRYPGKDEAFLQNEAYEMQKRNPLEDDHHLESFDKIQYERINNTYGILCLTADAFNFLMWSYYSDSHNGFCIGYDTDKLIDSGIFGMGGKVIYRTKFPLFPIFHDESESAFVNIFFTKGKIWEHEREYRLLHTYKTGKIQKIDSEIVKEIIFGCNFNEKDKLSFTKNILEKFPHVKISQMKLKKDSFGLKKEDIFNEDLILSFKNN